MDPSVRVSPKAKFICAKHRLFPLLAFYVFTKGGLTDVTNAACVVAPGPKRREPAAQEPKFLSQDPASVTFESIGDRRERKGWVALKEQVNVIGHDFHRVNHKRKLIRLFQQQRFQTIGNSIRKDRPAVLRTPNQVKLKRENRAGIACVPRHALIIHRARVFETWLKRPGSGSTDLCFTGQGRRCVPFRKSFSSWLVSVKLASRMRRGVVECFHRIVTLKQRPRNVRIP